MLTAEATEYIVSPAPGDEFGVSRAGEEVTVARDLQSTGSSSCGWP